MIEPGVLTLFQRYIFILFMLNGLGVCLMLGQRQATPEAIFRELIFALTTVLSLYLWLQPLRRWLGRWYLPIALLAAAVGPIVGEFLANVVGGLAGNFTLIDPGGLYLWLLPPLLLISMQYRYRALALYCVGTSALSIGLAAWQHDLIGQTHPTSVDQAVIRLLLFGFSGAILVYLSDAARRQRRELADKNAQIAQFAATLEELAVSRERNRLAREIHDTLAHTLSAITVQLKALDVLITSDPEAARRSLEETQSLTRAGLAEARRALHDLRASPIDDLGLALALQRAASAAAKRAGAALAITLPQQTPSLSPQVEQQIYRIAEEALNNIVRHADARHIRLELRVDPARIGLLVADDGRGFDATSASANGYFGVRGMRERALLIDAALTIDSAPGRGTRVLLSVPPPAAISRRPANDFDPDRG